MNYQMGRLTVKQCSLIFSFLFCVNTTAADASKQNLISEFIKVADYEQLFAASEQKSVAQLDTQIDTIRDKLNLSASEIPMFEDFKKNVMQVVQAEVNWQTTKIELTKMLDKMFTSQELEALIPLYRTSLIETLPKKLSSWNSYTADTINGQIKSLSPKVQQLTNEMVEELKKSRGSE